MVKQERRGSRDGKAAVPWVATSRLEVFVGSQRTARSSTLERADGGPFGRRSRVLVMPRRHGGRSQTAVARHERERSQRDGGGDGRSDDQRDAEAVEERLLRRREERRTRVATCTRRDLRCCREALARLDGEAG